jgi:glycosyltransferase involved in cell wall biosynthesis
MLNEMPLVSVVTPSYNSGRFIAETIESVRNQDYPSIEHIVIDGGSNDGTVEILKRCPQLQWVSEPDSGQSEALNKGFRCAKGEIIGWLNADDTYEPGAVAAAELFLREHEEVDLIYTKCRVVDGQGIFIRMAQSGPFQLEELLVKNFVKQPTVFMRRRVIEALGGVHENLHYVMDRELWLRAGLAFRLEFLPEKIFANFRLDKGTKSHDHIVCFHQEWLNVLDKIEFTDMYKFDEDILARARRKTLTQLHMAKFCQKYVSSHNEPRKWDDLILAIQLDWKLAVNPLTWKHIARALLKSSSTS